MLRSIKSTQRAPRQLAFKIKGTGTAAVQIGSKDAALTDNGTGDYTVTFAAPFKRDCVAVATSMTADVYCEIAAASATAVQVLVKATDDNAATDGDFMLIVQGYDSADQF